MANSMHPRLSPELKRGLVFFLALALLIVASQVGNVPVQALQSTYSNEAFICGKMVWLKNARTGAQEIGLLRCGYETPYVFAKRPGEILNYYQLEDPAIVEGKSFPDVKYGNLSVYITGFSSYRGITNCKQCGKPPTPTPVYYTFTPTFTPTQTATPTPSQTLTPTYTTTAVPSPTDTPTPTITLTPTFGPQADFGAQNPCVDYLARTVSAALSIANPQALSAEASLQMCAATGCTKCQEEGCFAQELNKAAVKGVVRAAVLPLPAAYLPSQVIPLITYILTDPLSAQMCGDPFVTAWEMARQFSLYGTPVDAFALHSPGWMSVKDEKGRRTGFQEMGEVVKEIPESSAVLAGETQVVLVPGGDWGSLDIDGNGDGNATVNVVENSSSSVKDYSFENVPLSSQSKSSLSAGSPSPLLVHDQQGNGQSVSFPPTSFEDTPRAAESRPTITPPVATAAAGVAATNAPAATSAIPGVPAEVISWALLAAICSGGLALFAFALWFITHLGRKR
jgi:hypothetical protein